MSAGFSRVALLAVPAAIAGAALLFAYDPACSPLFPRCLFHASTGFHCPGCGTLRAGHQLLHGNLSAAILLNPLAVLSLPVIGCLLLSRWLRPPSRRPPPAYWMGGIWLWVLMAVMVLFAVLRNVPRYPFSLLAP